MHQEGPLSFNGTSSNLMHVQVTPMAYSSVHNCTGYITYVHVDVVVSFCYTAVQLMIFLEMCTLGRSRLLSCMRSRSSCAASYV